MASRYSNCVCSPTPWMTRMPMRVLAVLFCCIAFLALLRTDDSLLVAVRRIVRARAPPAFGFPEFQVRGKVGMFLRGPHVPSGSEGLDVHAAPHFIRRVVDGGHKIF